MTTTTLQRVPTVAPPRSVENPFWLTLLICASVLLSVMVLTGFAAAVGIGFGYALAGGV